MYLALRFDETHVDGCGKNSRRNPDKMDVARIKSMIHTGS